MIKKLLIILLIFGAITAFHFSVSADPIDSTIAKNSSIYRFHLYYDSGQLYANRDFKFKYDIIPNLFVPENITTAKPFSADIIGVKGNTLTIFRFDPQKGKPSFTKGAINVDGPYFADAQKVNFYDDKNKLLLTLDVSGSSFCNDDGTCNSDVGENYLNCPNDCKAPTPSASPSATPVPGGGLFSQPLILIILLIVIAVIVVLAVWSIIKKRRKTAESAEIPPEIPPIS